MAKAKKKHQFEGFQIVYENRESDKMGGWRIYEGGDEVTDEFGFVNLSDAMMFARGAAAYRDYLADIMNPIIEDSDLIFDEWQKSEIKKFLKGRSDE